MTEWLKTGLLVLVAAAAAALAAWRVPDLEHGTDSRAADTAIVSEPVDPAALTSVEVAIFDERSASVRPLQARTINGRWVLASSFDYPIDGSDRLSHVIAVVLGLRRDALISDRRSESAAYGVVDPFEESAAIAAARGTRITLRGANDRAFVDVVVGHDVPGRPGYRYMRLANESLVYTTRIELGPLSTALTEWVNPRLLRMRREEIDLVAIRTDAIDARSGSLRRGSMTVMRLRGPDTWSLDGLARGERVNSVASHLLVTKLLDLQLLAIEPKPPSLAAIAAGPQQPVEIGRETLEHLRKRGFVIGPAGTILPTYGEVLVHCTNGVFYALRFGDLASEQARHLLISVGVDAAAAGADAAASHMVAANERQRFSPWYYQISEERVRSVIVERDALLDRSSPR